MYFYGIVITSYSIHYTKLYETKEAINITDSDRLVLHLSELEEFESKLFVNFNESLNTELGKKLTRIVITSYSIHYTKLYDM